MRDSGGLAAGGAFLLGLLLLLEAPGSCWQSGRSGMAAAENEPRYGRVAGRGQYWDSGASAVSSWKNVARRQNQRFYTIPKTSGGEGYWSTKGNRIVDENGDKVYFSGINWQGFEYVGCVVDGLMNRSIDSHLDQMLELGFNLIRLPFCGICIQEGVFPTPGYINLTLNPNLDNLTSIEVYSEVVKRAGLRNMKVILDYHRLAPPFRYDEEYGLWYNGTYNMAYFLRTWKMVVTRFVNDSTVVGVDIFNEPHNYKDYDGPYWLPDDRAQTPLLNWRTAARRAGNLILSINPHLLICVQGLWNGTGFGENLEGVRTLPLKLNVKNKLVYSIHEYGPALRVQPWHNELNFPDNMPAFWDYYFGYIHDENIAPVWVGEFGSLYNHTESEKNTKELAWLRLFVDYIHNKSLVWSWFTWCPNAQNVGGILSQDDWLTPREDKLTEIQSIMHPNFEFPAPIAPPPSPPLTPPLPPASPLFLQTPQTGGVLAPIGYSPPALADSPPPPSRATRGSVQKLTSLVVFMLPTLCLFIGLI